MFVQNTEPDAQTNIYFVVIVVFFGIQSAAATVKYVYFPGTYTSLIVNRTPIPTLTIFDYSFYILAC